uniref:Uncharacterized protein n=1 Tax=Macrostomum lignano TaxID=282301 RepID=A0A1I8FHG9_9PLAT
MEWLRPGCQMDTTRHPPKPSAARRSASASAAQG